jgi:rhodanese-related sulfurtransferase
MSPLSERTRTHRLLAGVAAVLAIGALAAGDPGARVDVDALARTVEAEEDHVDALELAEWIRDRRPNLRVVDVRSAADFSAFHIPTAQHLPLTAVVRAGFRPDETVVIYSEGGTHAAQAWFLLRAAGVEKVYFLRGGLYEWMTEVMSPILPSDATPSQRAGFARAAEISRYFGGMPRIGAASSSATIDGDPAAELPARDADEDDGGAAAEVVRVRRRGC